MDDQNAANDIPEITISDAVIQGNFEVFQRWLEIDPTIANTEIIDPEISIPIHFFHVVVRHCPNVEFVALLVEHYGVDINTKNEDGWTSLHQAAIQNPHVEVIKYLLEHGAEINAKDVDGWIPLHLVTSNPNGEVLKYLVEKGADVNAKTNYGDTALLDLAKFSPHRTVLNVDVFESLVNHGAEADIKDREGRTPLFYAAGDPKAGVEILKYLVDHGADVNVKDDGGWTPLYYAAMWQRDVEIFKYLVSVGADVNAKSENGDTPLHEVAKYGHGMEVFKYLVSVGADVNAKNKDGDTPLDLLNRNTELSWKACV